MSKYEEIDLNNITTYSVEDRPSKVHITDFISDEFVNTNEFIKILPNILAAKDLKELIRHAKRAIIDKKPIILMFGGRSHQMRASPLVNRAIGQEVISAIAVNGSVGIHDFEIAFFGKNF